MNKHLERLEQSYAENGDPAKLVMAKALVGVNIEGSIEWLRKRRQEELDALPPWRFLRRWSLHSQIAELNGYAEFVAKHREIFRPQQYRRKVI